MNLTDIVVFFLWLCLKHIFNTRFTTHSSASQPVLLVSSSNCELADHHPLCTWISLERGILQVLLLFHCFGGFYPLQSPPSVTECIFSLCCKNSPLTPPHAPRHVRLFSTELARDNLCSDVTDYQACLCRSSPCFSRDEIWDTWAEVLILQDWFLAIFPSHKSFNPHNYSKAV